MDNSKLTSNNIVRSHRVSIAPEAPFTITSFVLGLERERKWHSHAFYEIGIIENGKIDHYHEKPTTLGRGGVFFIFPGENHYHPVHEPATIHFLQFLPEFMQSCLTEAFTIAPLSNLFLPSLSLHTGSGIPDIVLNEKNTECVLTCIHAYKTCIEGNVNPLSLSLFRRNCYVNILIILANALAMEPQWKPAILKDQRIVSALLLIEEKIKDNKSTDEQEISRHLCVSPDYFRKLFKKNTGQSPVSYILKRKIMRSMYLLHSCGYGITQAALELNFCDNAYFTRCFRKITGFSPSEYVTLCRKKLATRPVDDN